MNDDTMGFPSSQGFLYSPSPSLEIRLARCILAWLDSQTLYQHYYDLVRDIGGLDGYDINRTRALRFHIWMNSNACMWPAPCQVKNSNDLHWQFAIIRLSEYLKNTPTARAQ